MHVIPSSWPSNTRKHARVSTSHTRNEASLEAVTTWRSLMTLMATTASSWPE